MNSKGFSVTNTHSIYTDVKKRRNSRDERLSEIEKQRLSYRSFLESIITKQGLYFIRLPRIQYPGQWPDTNSDDFVQSLTQPDEDQSTYHTASLSVHSAISGVSRRNKSKKSRTASFRRRGLERAYSYDERTSAGTKTSFGDLPFDYQRHSRFRHRSVNRAKLLEELKFHLIYDEPSRTYKPGTRIASRHIFRVVNTLHQSLRRAYGLDCINEAIQWVNRELRPKRKLPRLSVSTVRLPQSPVERPSFQTTYHVDTVDKGNWLKLSLLVAPTEEDTRKLTSCRRFRFRIKDDIPLIVLMIAVADRFNLRDPARVKVRIRRSRDILSAPLRPCETAEQLGLQNGDRLLVVLERNETQTSPDKSRPV
ncbi:unnamed protein product [Echinostoma caproni]|uniref:UBX domain-containing protein n=1 Tax=Echinostoma caproni TaxID=27848 RepID=A0A183ARF8_9TREM|nr:unnamed protein product [Echinostoma caproni]